MKTEINIQEIKQQFGLKHPEIIQIKDEPRTGFVRLICYFTDYPLWQEQKWYIMAETVVIDLAHNEIDKRYTTKSKGKDWIIDNDYKVIHTVNGVPVLNPDFKTEHDVEIEIGTNEETGEPIFETQTLPLEISLENSPFELVPAFDFYYYGYRHNRSINASMPILFESAVAADDMWGYLDTKENHYELLDVIKIIYAQMNP